MAQFYCAIDNEYQFIQMNRSVRKIEIIHNCGNYNLCQYNSATRQVKHCTTTTEGFFFSYGQVDGLSTKKVLDLHGIIHHVGALQLVNIL